MRCSSRVTSPTSFSAPTSTSEETAFPLALPGDDPAIRIRVFILHSGAIGPYSHSFEPAMAGVSWGDERTEHSVKSSGEDRAAVFASDPRATRVAHDAEQIW